MRVIFIPEVLADGDEDEEPAARCAPGIGSALELPATAAAPPNPAARRKVRRLIVSPLSASCAAPRNLCSSHRRLCVLRQHAGGTGESDVNPLRRKLQVRWTTPRSNLGQLPVGTTRFSAIQEHR